MLRSKYLMHIVILLLIIFFYDSHKTIAHEGHDHSHDAAPVTIERSTYKHFKSILSIYLELYDNLTKRQLSHIPVSAQILLDTAGKGIQAESKGSGRHLMQHIHHGAVKLRQAEGLQEMQEAFASISEAVLPFFKSWPNQLKSNKVKLYQCKGHENYWLQYQDLLPACPYTLDKSSNCSEINEVINE